MFPHHLQNIPAEHHQQRSAIELDKLGTYTAANQVPKVAMDRPYAQEPTWQHLSNGTRVEPARKQRTRSTQATWRRSMLKELANANISWDGTKSTESYPMEEPCCGLVEE